MALWYVSNTRITAVILFRLCSSLNIPDIDDHIDTTVTVLPLTSI